MKSLWKISIRYVLMAVFVILSVLLINAVVLFCYSYREMKQQDTKNIGQKLMEEIAQEITTENGSCGISEKGEALLRESSFAWAMCLDAQGDVVWSYQLPEEIPLHYSLGDVASFSRWYLRDFPIRAWRDGDSLLVFGMPKDRVTRVNLIYDLDMVKQVPGMVLDFLLLNALLILVLALLFGYRFYRSIKPIAEGIEGLLEEEPLGLAERGLTGELAGKLNRTSAVLRAQAEKLRQRDDARTSWISGVSHDIRTPLALITGYSDELAEDASLTEAARKKAGLIRSQCLLIRQLISDLNLTSKLEYHAQPLRCTYFSPAVLLRECVAEYYNQGLGENYDIAVAVEPGAEQAKLWGDRALLLRSFRNLIGNSLRHNPRGCEASVRLSAAAGAVVFEFSDTGPGIPEPAARALAEENGIQPDGVHVMGLRIVKQIAQAHGGEMELVKRENGNYDVRLVLPEAQEEKS